LIDPTMSDSSSVMNTGFEGDPSWSYGPTPAGGSSNQPPTTILGKNAPLTPVQMHATLPPSASGQKFMPAPFNAQKALTTLPEQTKQRAPGPSTPAFRYSQLLPNHGSFNRFLPPGTINKPQQ
jgi:hypothetical protein